MTQNNNLNFLVSKIISGDMTSFDILYSLTKKNVFLAAYSIFKNKEISEDIMQETYVQFLKTAKRIKTNSDVMGYLVLISKNLSINYYNRIKKEKEIINKIGIKPYSEDPFLSSPLLDEIKTILNDKEFQLFTLRVLGEYTFKEISEITNTPIGTLTWSYQEIIKKIKTSLKGYN